MVRTALTLLLAASVVAISGGCGGSSERPPRSAAASTVFQGSEPRIECEFEFRRPSGALPVVRRVEVPHGPDRRVVFRDVVVEFGRHAEGTPWIGANIGFSVFPRGSKRTIFPLDSSSFTLPDYRTTPLVNQLDPYGFTGVHTTYYRVSPRTVVSLAYFCRVL